MSVSHYRSPIGIVKVEETENIISSISVVDEEVELSLPQSALSKRAV